MSWVTNLLLACHAADDVDGDYLPPGLAIVKRWCEDPDQNMGQNMGWPQPVDTVAGGTKHLEVGLFAWAVNHLDFYAFMEVVRTAPWEIPECVQVFALIQGDETFELYTLTENRQWKPPVS